MPGWFRAYLWFTALAFFGGAVTAIVVGIVAFSAARTLAALVIAPALAFFGVKRVRLLLRSR